MPKSPAVKAANHPNNPLQSYFLILSGAIFLLLAWLLKPDPIAYPLGIFLFGVFMLVAAAFNPYRLLIAGIMTTLIGASIYMAFKPISLIPYGGDALYLVIAIGVILIAILTRAGYIGSGALTPGLIILVVGIIRYPPTEHLLNFDYTHFLLSLWFPGVGLLTVGLAYLLWALRK